MNPFNKYRFLSALINIGVDEENMPLGMVKNIRMFNRINALTIVILAFYAIVMFTIGSLVNGMLCLGSIGVFLLVGYLNSRGQRGIAKLLFTIWIMALMLFFSLFFGPNIGSEFWLIIIGSISLLIFRRRSNAMRLVLASLLAYILLELLFNFTEPIYPLSNVLERYVYISNVTFIFFTSFIISYVLRYSSEDFQRIVQNSNKILQDQNKDLTDSIQYAKRIQDAILPSDQLWQQYRNNFFVIFEPKDIVSGDFYWLYPYGDRVFFAVVDGAGHGVSGALTSIISHTLLNQCVEEYGKQDVLGIFEQFKLLIHERKDKWNDFLIEDIEVSICSYDYSSYELNYASNGNYFYLIKHVNNVVPGDGIDLTNQDRYAMKEIRNEHSFNFKPRLERDVQTASFTFQKDDMVYLATNGMSRQLGGHRFKKLKAKRLKDLLMSVQHFNVLKQKHIISDVLYSWKGKLEGTDDITLLGFKI